MKRDGIAYDLDLSDFVQWRIYYRLKDDTLEMIKRVLRPGDCVIDVGANVGEITLTAAQIVGPGGSVHAFEPWDSTFDQLARNVRLNQFANIFLAREAVGSHAGSVSMQARSGNSGANRVSVSVGAATIPVTTIDEYVVRTGLSRINLIKIDTEGFEAAVLAGAAYTIERFRPWLLIEVTDEYLRKYGSTASALLATLETWQYKVSRCGTGLAVSSKDGDVTRAQFDVVCVPLELRVLGQEAVRA